jgi:hypothetical protein
VGLTSGAGSSMLHDPPNFIFATTDCLKKVGLGLNAETAVNRDAAARKDTLMVEVDR